MADFPPVASLRSFEAVARLGSVTQAAHEMSVTHSAVSQHIKQLEALVGVTLFVRHGRGVRITEEGRLYALQIREALQHIADATRMVQIKPRTMELTLATLPSFGCHWLLPRLARFQARHPQIAVRLLTSLAVVNLQQEGIDLAIRMGQGDWEGMESRHLFADEQLVVAAPHYRGGDLPTTPQAIAASDIVFSMESWNAWCSQAGLEKTIIPAGLRLNDSNLVLEAVRLGAGVALERRSLVAGAIARGELVQLTAVTVPYPWHYWLTVSPQAENRPEVPRFIAWLEEEIALWRQQLSA
ncbi:LysR family transcriptional regulator [Klebsiella quasipneumoniae subsp. quasipneumoniae]|uniref:LysR substrate-binding domain-containing protein n=1 Tax=Klebsiella quasipneumoniae TaxID=1463165 RepID=UPI00109C16D6|nr:LysR substrate-binding domain-containing protein [Klebsiella quasipneumoniae]UDC72914.1 LysR family transcriptional regulator [Klebsiella quasipneumoniae subsp. quasipneumoniae]VGP32032.1 Glycine cleavage system transcriptional activator [Klebsiella quasipneumoniae subsp. quasipneumoniae]